MVLEGDAQRMIGRDQAGRRAIDADRAAGRLLQRGDQAQQGALAAAARPQDGDELAGRDRERELGERQHALPAARQWEALGDALDRDGGVHGLLDRAHLARS